MTFDKSLFDHVSPFLAVAENGSFTQAAKALGVTTTAISKAVRALEARAGTALLQRTTRRVALTEAGRVLADHLLSAAAQAKEGFQSVAALGETPTGTLRLTVPTLAIEPLLRPVIKQYSAQYPAVALEISVNDALVDLIGSGFDAGIRLGESVAKDMVAVRISPPIKWAIVGSPDYVAQHGAPQQLEDLLDHDAILYRFRSANSVHRWSFVRDGQELSIQPRRHIIVDDLRAITSLAIDGHGLAFLPVATVAQHVHSGTLKSYFESQLPSDSGYFLYFPTKSQLQPKLRAFIDCATSVFKHHKRTEK
ncbi:LysR family transcriptional regulator [Devosia sp. XK-2]|uniref:LysR family transcriptional regulator n=1 Tax=Devosia sp. XK-2 TaxID=3126689 RepID=UPI0030CBFB93